MCQVWPVWVASVMQSVVVVLGVCLVLVWCLA